MKTKGKEGRRNEKIEGSKEDRILTKIKINKEIKEGRKKELKIKRRKVKGIKKERRTEWKFEFRGEI